MWQKPSNTEASTAKGGQDEKYQSTKYEVGSTRDCWDQPAIFNTGQPLITPVRRLIRLFACQFGMFSPLHHY
jgi:hypothetical protein